MRIVNLEQTFLTYGSLFTIMGKKEETLTLLMQQGKMSLVELEKQSPYKTKQSLTDSIYSFVKAGIVKENHNNGSLEFEFIKEELENKPDLFRTKVSPSFHSLFNLTIAKNNMPFLHDIQLWKFGGQRRSDQKKVKKSLSINAEQFGSLIITLFKNGSINFIYSQKDENENYRPLPFEYFEDFCKISQEFLNDNLSNFNLDDMLVTQWAFSFDAEHKVMQSDTAEKRDEFEKLGYSTRFIGFKDSLYEIYDTLSPDLPPKRRKGAHNQCPPEKQFIDLKRQVEILGQDNSEQAFLASEIFRMIDTVLLSYQRIEENGKNTDKILGGFQRFHAMTSRHLGNLEDIVKSALDSNDNTTNFLLQEMKAELTLMQKNMVSAVDGWSEELSTHFEEQFSHFDQKFETFISAFQTLSNNFDILLKQITDNQAISEDRTLDLIDRISQDNRETWRQNQLRLQKIEENQTLITQILNNQQQTKKKGIFKRFKNIFSSN